MLVKTLAHLFHPRLSNNHRPRVLHPEVLVILALVMVVVFAVVSGWRLFPGRLGDVLGYASAITPDEIVQLTNKKRSKAGLPALQYSPELAAAAFEKGQHMFAHQYWAHTAPDGTTPWVFIKNAGYSYQVAGENLARDFIISSEVVDAWVASPTHRANLMNSRYTDIGIAVINGPLEGIETTLVIQMFGKPRVVEANRPQVQAAQTDEPLAGTSGQLETILTGDGAPAAPVLAAAVIPNGELRLPPLFSPLQILKATSLALVILLVTTLTYDSLVIGNRSAMRLVGHNFGHVILCLFLAFLIISFKGGILG